MIIGNREFDPHSHIYVCGILNITPDSFSDGGSYTSLDRALYRVQEMVQEGVDLLDIGGESSRPGYTPVSEEEEMERVLPVLEAVKREFYLPVSLDTCKAKVAQEGIRAGADMINDIWGLQKDPQMGSVIAKGQVACCLMHNRATHQYQNFVEEVVGDLKQILKTAKEAGISEDKIILDPGVGFGKEYHHNLLVLKEFREFTKLGYPLLLGVSRKSVIGLTLKVETDERMAGSLAAAVAGMVRGCSFLRVHDVKEHVHAVRMIEAIREVQSQ